jgi:hypothetical protein
MSATKLIIAAALMFVGMSSFARQEKQEPAKPLAADPQVKQEDTVKKLQKERLDVLKQRLAIAQKLFSSAAGPIIDVRFWEEQVALAEAEMNGRPADLREIYARIIASIRAREKLASETNSIGTFTLTEQLEMKAVRLSFEIRLAQLPSE